MKIKAVFFKEKKWWIGWAEEIPGANAQGKTLEEAKESLKESVQLILESNRELSREKAKQHKGLKEIAIEL